MTSFGLDNTEEKAPERYAMSSAPMFAEVCSALSDIKVCKTLLLATQ